MPEKDTYRRFEIHSSQQKEGRSINKIWNLLSENGYSSKLLKKLLREVLLDPK